jgi:protein-tyrosine phosphatase
MTSTPFADRAAGAVLLGAPNFRDLGGARRADGRRVRHGCVFRSGHLGELHSTDVAALRAHLGEDVCVIDLRSEGERMKLSCVLPGAAVQSLPIEPTVGQKLLALAAAGQPMTPREAGRFMREAYEGFVLHARPQLAAFFGHVLQRAGRPVVIHCAAGKDRTGFLAAMLLTALGVARADVLEDYLVTNARVSPRESDRFPPEIMQVLGTVRAEFLEAAFGLIDSEFGSAERYLAQAAGLDPRRRARLQALLLA